nr:hypothetical protein [Pseudodesulfovibrio sp.]
MNQSQQPMSKDVEARDFVEFYRFWAWEYTKRNPEFRKMIAIIKGAESYFKGLGLSGFTMDAHVLTDTDAIQVFRSRVGRDFTESERELFKEAFLERKKARYKFGFDRKGPLPHTNYLSEQVLELLQNGDKLIRPTQARERSEGSRLVQQREIQHGFKVLYDRGFPVFGYDVLVAIDFDRPIEEIKFQMENIKEEFELYRKIENAEKDIQLNIKTEEIEKIGIQKNPNIKFNTGTDNSRAIGIWLCDYIQNADNPKKRGIISEAIRALRERFDLGSLGYGESESRVFRNIHAKTQRCIDAAEVLSLN